MAGLNFGTLAPYDRVTFRGRQMNARDAAAHLESERRFGATVYIPQGGFNPGGVAASGGAHDAGGALDWSLSGMSSRAKKRWDHAVKDTGWCAWHRPYIDGLWPEHEHGVARGCKNLSPVAFGQVGAFDRKEDGLVGDGMDYSYRPQPKVEFDYAEFKAHWVARNQLTRITDRVGSWKREVKGLRRKILAARKDKQRIRRQAGLS